MFDEQDGGQGSEQGADQDQRETPKCSAILGGDLRNRWQLHIDSFPILCAANEYMDLNLLRPTISYRLLSLLLQSKSKANFFIAIYVFVFYI